jgi:PKD repeat protein
VSIAIEVIAVADSPTLTAEDASGDEGSPIPLVISASLADTDGSETLSITIAGVPADSTLSAGIDDGGGNWSLTPEELIGLTITVPDDTWFDLDITAIATEVSNASTASTSASIHVTVLNVAPILVISGPDEVNEGSICILSLASSDPGEDTITSWTIDWDDGVVDNISGNPSSAEHVYADGPADHTISGWATDEDGTYAAETVIVTVNNVLPTLNAGADQTADEGTFITLDPATFTDPGFDNPAGGTVEDFTAAIDWGDGNSEPLVDITLVEVPGAEGILTTGTIDATHAYGDNGIYTVTVTVQDDDGIAVSDTFQVTVNNVAPALTVVGAHTIAEGALLSLIDLGTITDPGFDNPANPSGPSVETFTYSIDWGDGTLADTGSATIDAVGSEGYLTGASFDGSHTFADNGTYIVTVIVTDDDGGTDTQTFDVTVSNVNPTIDPDSVVNSSPSCGGAASGDAVTVELDFFDPGFDHDPPETAFDTSEDFDLTTIDWGDGTVETTGDITVTEVPGSPGVLTTGGVHGSHVYEHGGIFTITLTVRDDDGGEAIATTTTVITGAGLIDNTLYIIGTSEVDHVTVNQQGNGLLRVHADFLSSGNFRTFDAASVEKIIAYLCDGNDNLTIAGNVHLPAIVHGGGGNDHLNAGSGPSVLLGDGGADMLVGGSGRDVLIGGIGADRLVGGTDEDVLTGGSTAGDDALMIAIIAAWDSDDSYDDRVETIINILLMEDDQQEDQLTGSAGRDLFFEGLGDILTDVRTNQDLKILL